MVRGRPAASAAAIVRPRVRRGGPRYWKLSDFPLLPPSAVATALSRLSREAELTRVAKGVYYHPVPTSFGLSVPATSTATAYALTSPVHPAGLTAANVLGLSSQNPVRPEYASASSSAPTSLGNAIVHPRRPRERDRLTPHDGAILEVLRDRATTSDLSPPETVARLLELLREQKRFTNLVRNSKNEPPRVRAMLGALGQQLGADEHLLDRLRASLNPLSRFDFGQLRHLRYARDWQAK